MSPEIGRVEKPEAEQFKRSRKLYLVPLVVHGETSPEEFKEKVQAYWREVKGQLANLESRIGQVRHVYHESIVIGDEAGIKVMEEFNPVGSEITREKCAAGAVFELTEDRQLAEEAMDWERCLLLGFMTDTVAGKVSEFHAEASRKRYEHIAKRIDETLKDEEAGLIFIHEGHRVQFPKSIEVFIVFPPSLNEIHRWLRDQAEKRQKQAVEETEKAEKGG